MPPHNLIPVGISGTDYLNRSGASVPEGPARGAPVALSRYTYPSHKGVSVPAPPLQTAPGRDSGTEAWQGVR